MRSYLKYGHAEIDKIIPVLLEKYEMIWNGLQSNDIKEKQSRDTVNRASKDVKETNFNHQNQRKNKEDSVIANIKDLVKQILINYAENRIAEFLEYNIDPNKRELKIFTEDIETTLLLFPLTIKQVLNNNTKELKKILKRYNDNQLFISQRNSQNSRLKKDNPVYKRYNRIIQAVHAEKISVYAAVRIICKEDNIENCEKLEDSFRKYLKYNKKELPIYSPLDRKSKSSK
ncbi:MAG: hypothetical protein KKA84_09370 [Bacteroidetes bacterium]|nr:hypothetical protein [Bacteroidota bacterium]